MAKSVAFATDPSRQTSSRFSYIPAVCDFVALCQPGASAAIIDPLSIPGPLLEQAGVHRRHPVALLHVERAEFAAVIPDSPTDLTFLGFLAHEAQPRLA